MPSTRDIRPRVLITGAGGQLASQFLSIAKAELPLEFLFRSPEEMDITSAEQVYSSLAELRPDWIVNTAAYTAVDRAERESDRAFLVNAVGVGYLAAFAKTLSAKLIHISTDYVFAQEGNTPRSETETPSPRGVYARSKREGEIRVLSSGEGMVIRTAWLYSRFGKNFYLTMRDLMEKKRDLRVVYDQVGTPTWAGSLAQAICALILGDCYRPGLYHYTNLGLASWYDFAVAVAQNLEAKVAIAPIRTGEFPTDAPRPPYSVLDSAYTRQCFGLEAVHWSEALRRCMDENYSPIAEILQSN